VLAVLTASAIAAQDEAVLVDVARHIPGIELKIRYASSDNFTGTPVDGYHTPLCLLTEPAARALGSVQRELSRSGLHLVLFDCYRPQRAVDHFMRWVADLSDQGTREEYYPNVPKQALVSEGYIAEKSGHSRGSTVDLTLASSDGSLLDMGTAWDFFDPTANTDNDSISTRARSNRMLLVDVMARHGFRNYPGEWWHFTLENEPLPDTYLDIPIM
jgi:D-alanyl-D-alanine dipeptidase